MNKKELVNLQEEISKVIELGKEWALKWEIAKKLHNKLRNKELLQYFSNEILEAKYEKLINSIDTLWTDRHGYTWAWIFTKYKEIIDLEIGQNKIIDNNRTNFKQEFFKTWEEANVKFLLKTLFSDAKNGITIYDKYFSLELLRILAEVKGGININIIYIDKTDSVKNDEFKAFETLYNCKIKKYPTKDKSIHDRYYIIDWKVYSLWSSVQKNIHWTLFTPVIESEWDKIIKEVNKYLK